MGSGHEFAHGRRGWIEFNRGFEFGGGDGFHGWGGVYPVGRPAVRAGVLMSDFEFFGALPAAIRTRFL